MFTFNTTLATYRFGKTSTLVIIHSFGCAVDDDCTIAIAEFFFTTLKRFATCNYLATALAGVALDAGFAAIFFVLSKPMRLKFFSARLAFCCAISSSVKTFFTAINLTLTAVSVVTAELLITDGTGVHVSTLCLV
jgi:hypothetical protein